MKGALEPPGTDVTLPLKGGFAAWASPRSPANRIGRICMGESSRGFNNVRRPAFEAPSFKPDTECPAQIPLARIDWRLMEQLACGSAFRQ